MTNEVLIESLAAKLKRAGLTEVAIFFLEAHRPLSGIFHFLALLVSPLVPVTLGKDYAHLLEDPKFLDKLYDLLVKES